MKHKLLFICLGNICRSPAAEGIMKALVRKAGREDEFYIDSAGIGGWHIGLLPDPRMRKHGARHGYDFCSRARQFTTDDFARFDLIITMDEDNYEVVTDRARTPEEAHRVVRMASYLSHHQASSIPDPYYGGDQGFESVIALLEDACQGLLDSFDHPTASRS